MIDPEDLFFPPVGFERFLKFARALKIFAEWFLDLGVDERVAGEGSLP